MLSLSLAVLLFSATCVSLAPWRSSKAPGASFCSLRAAIMYSCPARGGSNGNATSVGGLVTRVRHRTTRSGRPGHPSAMSWTFAPSVWLEFVSDAEAADCRSARQLRDVLIVAEIGGTVLHEVGVVVVATDRPAPAVLTVVAHEAWHAARVHLDAAIL